MWTGLQWPRRGQRPTRTDLSRVPSPRPPPRPMKHSAEKWQRPRPPRVRRARTAETRALADVGGEDGQGLDTEGCLAACDPSVYATAQPL